MNKRAEKKTRLTYQAISRMDGLRECMTHSTYSKAAQTETGGTTEQAQGMFGATNTESNTFKQYMNANDSDLTYICYGFSLLCVCVCVAENDGGDWKEY